MLHPVINGAYTELFAGLSDEVTLDQTGAWSKSHFHPFMSPFLLLGG